MNIIEIINLQKNYGKHVGVKDVSFSVKKGEVYGFVGPNGAGKSTTIKALMGFIFPTSGFLKIKDLDAINESKAIKQFVGYVPSDVRLYSGLSVSELLKTNDSFYKRDLKDETNRLCNLFEVDTKKRFSELSTGNKKKISIISALVQNPEVIILDEPTSGLDPIMQKVLFEELKDRTALGATVLLSSHNLAEVEEYCDRVAFIRDGSILAVIDLKSNLDLTKIVTLTNPSNKIPKDFELLSSENEIYRYRTNLKGDDLINSIQSTHSFDFTVENENMEERFWNLYDKGDK